MRTAVIGIGSNSLRMLVADIHQGRLKRLKRYREGLRVFAALEANGAISRDMTQRACESVGRFRARAMEDGACEVRLFATSAVRDAVNRQAFCDALRDSTGLTADVLSGEQEARLSFLGATESTDRGLIDIGGGSTEIVSGRGDHIDAAISLQLGAVRLFRAMPILTVQDARRVEAFARDKVREGLTPEHAHASASGGWVGVGGTFTTTAALVQRIPWDQRELIHGFALGREALEQALGSLFSSHLEKLSAKIGRETRDALEREVLLKAVDMAWMDHIDNMDQLKQGIGLRSYGQNDPVKEYTKEGFAMFDEMVQEIQENTIRTLLRCQADS